MNRTITRPPIRALARSFIPSLEAVIPTSRGFSSCPFQVLGFKRKRTARSNPHHRREHDVTYEQVRASFRVLALKHHPDTNSSGSDSTEFTLIRKAFESIVEGPDGIAVLRDDYQYQSNIGRDESYNNDSDSRNTVGTSRPISFQDDQNGFLHPSIHPQILHEVADVAKKMNPGGLDKGGMWQYANMIRNMAEDKEKGLPPLRVGEGDNANMNEKRRPVRRRRRK